MTAGVFNIIKTLSDCNFFFYLCGRRQRQHIKTEDGFSFP